MVALKKASWKVKMHQHHTFLPQLPSAPQPITPCPFSFFAFSFLPVFSGGRLPSKFWHHPWTCHYRCVLVLQLLKQPLQSILPWVKHDNCQTTSYVQYFSWAELRLWTPIPNKAVERLILILGCTQYAPLHQIAPETPSSQWDGNGGGMVGEWSGGGSPFALARWYLHQDFSSPGH